MFVGVFSLFIMLMSSCMKSGSWFPDMDCVTKQVEVMATLSPDQLPPQGGNVPLLISAQQITHFIQYGKEIKSESTPIPYEVVLENNPDGFKLENVGGDYVLSCPINTRNTAIQLTMVVIVNGERKSFELIQNPKTYNVEVEIV